MFFLLSALFKKLIRDGTLQVTDPAGKVHHFGRGLPEVGIGFRNFKSQWSVVRDPTLGAAESFMNGSMTLAPGTDILALLDLFTRNMRWHPDNPLRQALGSPPSWWTDMQQWNARRTAKRNVAHHYDLSGKLYDLFLDNDKQYSCAYFRDGVTDLTQAQHDKKAHIAAKLLLKPEHKVLDIGCGWGGMALYLNRVSGCDVTGITLSEEQLAVAQQRAQPAQDKVRFALSDYRDMQHKFDRIVSVGMFEHVGKPNYGAFFKQACGLLEDNGVMLIHTIGRADGPGVTDGFTRKYIFPGGYCPALSEFMPAIERAGLYVTDIEVLRLHYAHTLKAWYDRTIAAKAEIVALYDERFYRMWTFYLASAWCGFQHLGHVVFQIQLARRQDAVPLTRDYLQAAEQQYLHLS
jgi:cyclopropane-fatty-acyl-phospholipid synthase